jgi:hypothetical protein
VLAHLKDEASDEILSYWVDDIAAISTTSVRD